MHNVPLRRLTAALAAALPLLAQATEPNTPALDEIVITAPQMSQPLTIELDPKAPQQPVPASDGASFLKNIPGFSMIRKGGTDGDPVLRGLAGSRLPILLDGMDFHGGCNNRMDPPTAYVFPESFSRVRVIKGPQTVLYGNGNAAGVVLFENDRTPITPGVRTEGSAMVGSWGRRDLFATGEVAGENTSFKATMTHSESGNYKDGDGTEIHSSFRRQSLNLSGGYEFDRDTRIDLDGTVSRGKAAYADRAMDGSVFDRESYGLTFSKKNLSPLVKELKARVYHSYVDHVMDNYSMRYTPACANGASATACAAMNPDRETDGARVSVDLALSAQNQLTVGADWRRDEHTTRHQRGSSAAVAGTFQNRDRLRDFTSEFTGIFGEYTREISDRQRLIAGLRVDDWSASRTFVGMGAEASAPGTPQGRISETLKSGFLRYEQDFVNPSTTAYVGYGMSQRPMDYWEANLYEGIQSNTRSLKPEATHQIDAGLLWKSSRMQGSLSVFYSKVKDYVLLYSGSGVSPAGGPMGAGTMPGGAGCLAASGLSNSRNHQLNSCLASGNIDATRYGAEADLSYRLTDAMTIRSSLAYVRAQNDTMNMPLAQTPPLEARFGLDYKTGAWSFGGVVRAVSKQDRIHPLYGNIAGFDRATTSPGFATLALNASYKLNKNSLISFGIDNVFDRTYSEHLSKGDATIAGYAPASGDRVNEPGRFVWVKLSMMFD